MLPRFPVPWPVMGGQGGLGRVVPIYCICQPHYHALASWHGTGRERNGARICNLFVNRWIMTIFRWGLMASCRMRMSCLHSTDASVSARVDTQYPDTVSCILYR